MAGVDTVFEQLGTMTVLELVELKKKIEDEWGITAAAAVAVAAPGGGGGGAEAAEEEKTTFDVVLTSAGERRVDVIKVVRSRHRARAQGVQGHRRPGPGRRQGRREQGRGRLDQGPARGGRGDRRAQVSDRRRRPRGAARGGGVAPAARVGGVSPTAAARAPPGGCYPGDLGDRGPSPRLAARGSAPLSWEVRRVSPRLVPARSFFPVRPHP